MSRKGTLTGGYYDSRKSRLDLQRQMWENKRQLEAAEGEKADLRQQLEDILYEPTNCSYECSNLYSKLFAQEHPLGTLQLILTHLYIFSQVSLTSLLRILCGNGRRNLFSKPTCALNT